MDLRDIRYFQLVARLGHVGRAAQHAHRTQPAITKAIQRIEEELGAPVFDRGQRKLVPSALGRLLQARSELLLSDLDDLQRDLKAAARGEAGHVRLGVSATAAEFLLPQLSAELLRAHPDITLEIDVGMNDSLAAALAAHRLDIVIAPLTRVENELVFERLVEDHVVVVASTSHPLARSRRIDLARLGQYRWVLPSRSTEARQWLERQFVERSLPKPVTYIESSSISLTPRLISSTTLLSFISRRNLAMEPLASTVCELRLDDLVMRRDFGILLRRGAQPSPAARAVHELVVSCARSLFARSNRRRSVGRAPGA